MDNTSKRLALFVMMAAAGCAESGGDAAAPTPDEGPAVDGGPPVPPPPPDEVLAYDFAGVGVSATVERHIHADGSESLHGETLVDLGGMMLPIVLRAIDDVDLDAGGLLVHADLRVLDTVGDIDSARRIVLDPQAGEVRITRPAGAFVWNVPTDAPWAYYHFLSDVYLGLQTPSPVAAWVNARAAEASDTIRGINYDALFSSPLSSADLYQDGAVLVGADAIKLGDGFVDMIVVGQLGALLVRTDEDLGDLLDFDVPEGAPAVAPDCALPGTAQDFTVASADGTTIAGTINLPPGATGPIPFVVLNLGTGGCDRDCLMAGRPTLACLAKPLVEAGVGVVRYDDRGRGQSGGSVETLTFHQRSDDATAVAAMVAARPDVQSDALFLLGWSEGVAHASIAAARVPEVDGLLLMAGVGKSFAQALPDQGDVYLASYGMPQAFISQHHAGTKAFVNQVLAGTFPEDFIGGLPVEYFRQSFQEDGGALAAAGARPAAIFQGWDDWQVAESNAGLLAAAIGGAGVSDVEVHRYDTGHAFVPLVPGFPSGEEYALPLAFDADFLADLVAWVDAHR